ncbi:prepilin-type N-terminal cleavage/methylation domain-containing protein [Candidatus Woesebacteria bacterium]|nr:prepilin-type N-terminal cleavage/methylation domain-containing protein [Candidatus Woesebacteria bacterium]
MHTPPTPRSDRTQGFTLIEVVVFVAIASIIFVTIVSFSINVIRQSLISQHKLYATRYADELAEWLRVQKELSWQDFYTKSQAPPTPNKVYCANDQLGLTTDLNSGLAIGDCVDYDGIRSSLEPQIYKRSIAFSAQPDNQKSVKGTVLVEWQEANGTLYSVQVETLFAPR